MAISAKSLKHHMSLIIREYVLKHYLIPYSRHGVPQSILQYITAKQPLSIIDVGASRGYFSESLRKVYGLKKALLIEPQPELSAKLKESFKDEKVMVYCCALGESERVQEMEILNWDYSSSLLNPYRNINKVNTLLDLDVRETIQCQVRKLDNILQEIGWSESIDLLKLDVQGAELMVLSGAEETLRRTNMIFTEVSFISLYEGAPVFQEVYDYLHNRGYKLLTISDGFRGADGDLLQADVLFCRN